MVTPPKLFSNFSMVNSNVSYHATTKFSSILIVSFYQLVSINFSLSTGIPKTNKSFLDKLNKLCFSRTVNNKFGLIIKFIFVV